MKSAAARTPFPSIADFGVDLTTALQKDLKSFEELTRILKDASGINLPPNNKNICLLASRMTSVLKSHGLDSYPPFLERLKGGDQALLTEFVSTMTTNTTQFFREPKHFDILRERLPAILEAKRKAYRKELRVWCAAASTGQEPYTILMTLMESIPDLAKWQLKFLATDIDLEVLRVGARGVYAHHLMEGVPPIFRQKYFAPTGKSEGEYRVRDSIRSQIRFAPFNLMTRPFPFQHSFDIVFCRNVLIYFDSVNAKAVVDRLGGTLGEGGLLFLGHSESGAMKSPLLTSIAAAAYVRKGGK